MAQPVIQTSFNAGEWAPALNARVDLQKYHSGAALIRNFFVDYRGGATTRPGSRYILKARSSSTVRIIPFQASLGVTYVLEFGANYIRFYNNGAPVLENATSIIAAVPGPPEVFTDTAHGYANGDWLFIGGNFYITAGVTTNTFTLTDLFGNAINTNPFTLPINAQRVFTLLNSPYLSNELFQIKYAQNVNTLILCHPNHPPFQLVLNASLAQPNWTLSQITFGSTISAPGFTSSSLATFGSGGTTGWLSYIVTAVDINGQESAPSVPTTVTGTFFGLNFTITLAFSQPTGAVSFNLYKTVASLAGVLPVGSQYGFIGNVTGSQFTDTNIVPNFAIGPPVPQSPFSGAGVQSLTLTAQGSGYTSVPVVTLTGGSPSVQAQASATIYTAGVGIASGGNFYTPTQLLTVTGTGGLQLVITSVGAGGNVTGFSVYSNGTLAFPANTPANPVATTVSSGPGTGCTININWSVLYLTLISPGAGYLSAPSVVFSGGGAGGGAAATATLGASSAGNPSVPAITQQRLFLAGPVLSPAQFNLSQPGAVYNYNTTFPIAADNAIQATLNGVTLNSIKSAVGVSAGLVVFSDKGAWLINGGTGAGSPISALQIVANPQAYSGAADLPPLVTPNDILYVQSKGSIVRDLAYNFYLANYVGEDISVLSSHLFYKFKLTDWCWSEEPFKVAWAVRNDGTLLSLTFVKEQELIAWAQHNSQGNYVSICTVPENTAVGLVDAVYTVIQRSINGVTVNYIERFVELNYPNDYKSSWQVDAGIGYNGPPATTFSGAQHLGGQIVTGVADGVVINFTMPVSGTFVFGGGGTPGLTAIASASIVTVGMAFTPVLTTLPIDLGEPTVQGKRKKISAVDLKIANALGLSMGSTQANALAMQDLIIGNVGSQTNAIVTGLVTADVRMIIDPDWNVPGQYTIVQPNPYPASVLGVIPEITVGDTPK